MFIASPRRQPHRGTSLMVLALAVAVLSTGHANADIVYENVNAVTAGNDPVVSDGPFYNSFSNGFGRATLDQITAIISSPPNPTGELGQFIFDVLSDDNGKPGAPLIGADYLDSSIVAAPTEYDLGLHGLILESETRYWVEMYSPDQSSLAQWAFSYDTNGKEASGEFFGTLGKIYPNLGNAPFQMQVSVTPLSAPEPATWAMMLVGVGGLGATLRRRRLEARSLAAG